MAAARAYDDRVLCLTVRAITGTDYAVSIPAEESTTGLRLEMARRLHLAPGSIGLSCNGALLTDGVRLADCALRDGSIVLCFPLVGSGAWNPGPAPPPGPTPEHVNQAVQRTVQDLVNGIPPEELQSTLTANGGVGSFVAPLADMPGMDVHVSFALLPDQPAPTGEAPRIIPLSVPDDRSVLGTSHFLLEMPVPAGDAGPAPTPMPGQQAGFHPLAQYPPADSRAAHEAMDTQRAAEKREESRRIDNRLLSSKIDAMKAKLKQRRRKRNTSMRKACGGDSSASAGGTAAAPSATAAATTTGVLGVEEGRDEEEEEAFAGLSRGFLFQQGGKRAHTSSTPSAPKPAAAAVPPAQPPMPAARSAASFGGMQQSFLSSAPCPAATTQRKTRETKAHASATPRRRTPAARDAGFGGFNAGFLAFTSTPAPTSAPTALQPSPSPAAKATSGFGGLSSGFLASASASTPIPTSTPAPAARGRARGPAPRAMSSAAKAAREERRVGRRRRPTGTKRGRDGTPTAPAPKREPVAAPHHPYGTCCTCEARLEMPDEEEYEEAAPKPPRQPVYRVVDARHLFGPEHPVLPRGSTPASPPQPSAGFGGLSSGFMFASPPPAPAPAPPAVSPKSTSEGKAPAPAPAPAPASISVAAPPAPQSDNGDGGDAQPGLYHAFVRRLTSAFGLNPRP